MLFSQTSRWSDKGAGALIRKIRKNHIKSKFGWEARRIPAKNARDEEGGRHTHEMKSTSKLTSMAAGIRLQHHSSPRSHNPPTRDYSGCCLESCPRRAKHTCVVVNREEHACSLGCCQSEDSWTCSEKRGIELKNRYHACCVA